MMRYERQSSLDNFPLWLKLTLSAISGVLIAATMPGYDVPLLGWVALVPMLIVVMTSPARHRFYIALPFGLVFSSAVHNWYPHIFPPALGYFLILAVGMFYAGIIQLGVWIQSRVPGALKMLALPVTWSAVEFVKFIAPVVEDWWFVLLAKSQWRFPSALQILSVTGFPGLSFLIVLANVALAFILMKLISHRSGKSMVDLPPVRVSVAALTVVVIIISGGVLAIPQMPAETFTIAALTDMVNQDPAVLSTSEFTPEDFGTGTNPPETSQAVFDVDAALTRSVVDQHPTFIVWPENEFADADDPQFIDQLKGLAAETGSYIVADVVWYASTGKHDTALMVSPTGDEVGRRAKINITEGEQEAGFVPGPREYLVFETPYGKVGLGVCWDRHRLFITRELARNGAEIMLMTVDDDFDGTPWFPPFHASDGVFRAVENHVTYGLGTINGLSLVVDPFGRIMAEGGINERSVILGEVFTAPGGTLYSRWGDWFGWLMVVGWVGMIGMAVARRKFMAE